jgi:hypothetical protein
MPLLSRLPGRGHEKFRGKESRKGLGERQWRDLRNLATKQLESTIKH